MSAAGALPAIGGSASQERRKTINPFLMVELGNPRWVACRLLTGDSTVGWSAAKRIIDSAGFGPYAWHSLGE